MTRPLLTLPIALSLLAAPALAGPEESGAGAADALMVDCQINGRTERFSIADGALSDGNGSISVLAEGVYAVTRGGTTYLIDPTGVQVDEGPDRGKWDCVEVAGGGAAAELDLLAQVTELEGEVANLEAALSAAQGDRDAAITSRDLAEAALAEAMAERDALRARSEELQALVAAAEAESAEAQVQIETLGAQLNAALAQIAMAEQEAAEDAAPMAEPEAAEPDASTVMTVEGFDADAALTAISGSDLGPIAQAALSEAVERARANPDLVPEVVARLQLALGG